MPYKKTKWKGEQVGRKQHEAQDDVRLYWEDLRLLDFGEVAKWQDQGFLYLQQVPDPRGSDPVIFFSRSPLTGARCQAIWDNWDWTYEEAQRRA